MFASGRQGKPAARDGRESDDDDWLRVGRSFKGATTASVNERALQVYSRPKEKKKNKKRSRSEARSDTSGGSDSEHDQRRSRKHGKDHKVKKKKKKNSKRSKRDSKHQTPRHRSRSDSESDSPSSGSSENERRRPSHDKRGSERSRRRHRAEDVVRYRRPAAHSDRDELALLDEPCKGELEVYAHSRDERGEKLFEFDCIGDRENLIYGTLYRHEQPLYHLATRRSITDGTWLVERQQHARQLTPQHAEDSKRFDTDRYFGRIARAAEKKAGSKRLRLAYSQRRLARLEQQGTSGHSTRTAAEIQFIPLDALVDGELDGVLTAQDAPPLDQSKSNSDTARLLWQTDHENTERFVVQRQKALNEHVTANPYDVDAWLDVIAFQDQTLRLTGAKQGNERPSSIIEKQKAVWEKAIEKNPTSRRLRGLQLKLLWHEQQSKGDFFHSDTNRALVEQLLKSDKTNASLWAKLIQCSQQKFGTFSMPVLRDLYARVISVVNKELTEHLKSSSSSVPVTARTSSSFIHVMSSSSLLGVTNPYEAEDLDERAVRLTTTLLQFHRSMLQAEVKAGYTERAVALGQALIEFNYVGESQASSNVEDQSHQETFIRRWSEELTHFGQCIDGESVIGISQLPGAAVAERYASQLIAQMRESVRTPGVILSSEHAIDLAGPHFVDDHGDNGGDSRGSEDSTAIGDMDTENGGRWVYSNLHGQRIWIADSDESKEYERILAELRGSDASHERQLVQDRKLQVKNSQKAETLARRRDERADYVDINPDDDEFFSWLIEETRAELSQWEPLQPSNPHHSDLLESQPDRAILVEEILPFVYRIPGLFRVTSVLNLLEVMGVRLANAPDAEDDPTHLLASDDFDEYAVFTTSILKALDPTSPESIGLSTRDRIDLAMAGIEQHVKVSVRATVDPSRVQFIRTVLEASVRSFSSVEDACRLLKVMWMQYEYEVLFRGDAPEQEATAFRSFCQALIASPGESAVTTVDSALLSVYAAVELRLDNKRLAARICDKTVESLALSSAAPSSKHCRAFHRLVFVRIQEELTNEDGQLAVLKAFYLLWRVWAPHHSDTLDSILKHYRKSPAKLEAHLRAHREQHQYDIVGKYRLELQIALDECRSKKPLIEGSAPLACNVAFALFNLCAAVYTSLGFAAAKQEFDAFLSDNASGSRHCHDRQCWYMLLAFMQIHHASKRAPALPPREWRETVARGVNVFPFEPIFLRLFVDAETSNTQSQSLRKYFYNRRLVWQRGLDSPELVEWLFALLCEFARAERCGIKYASDATVLVAMERPQCCVLHRWGKNLPAVERIRRVFEEMITQLKTSGAAIGWRLYLRFELAVGKVEAARKVFYRGLAKCPWSKAMYLDGIRLMRPYLSRDECHEISNFLAAKELHVRVDA